MVLNGERFSKTIINATGIAVIRKTKENICQKILQFIFIYVLLFFLPNFMNFAVKNNQGFYMGNINIFFLNEGKGKMKQVLALIWFILFLWACSAPKGVVKVEKTEPEAEVDSIEYGMETFDAKFDAWYALHKSQAMNRSQKYYENWNKKYVKAWNHKAKTMPKDSFFEPIVGFNFKEHYGFDINHKLFYYFQYVENVLKIEIMPKGPKVVTY